jgi:phenylpyruvate tautomerase PptA (4-oxalocrotonate tautomerase family)
MPMIDVTVPESTFSAEAESVLLSKLTECLLKWEKVTGNKLATANTGAYLHCLPKHRVTAGGQPDAVVRIDVLTPPGILSQEQRTGFTAEATEIVGQVSGDPNLAKRTWVLMSETVDGGWGIAGYAFTLEAIAAAIKKAALAAQNCGGDDYLKGEKAS